MEAKEEIANNTAPIDAENYPDGLIFLDEGNITGHVVIDQCRRLTETGTMIIDEANIRHRPVFEKEVGGDHYKLPIQPIEFISKNSIPFIEGNIIKYVCRHRNKNGAEDIKKAIHYLEMLLEIEYNK